MLRNNQPARAPPGSNPPEGLKKAGGESAKLGTRLRFPQVSRNLRVQPEACPSRRPRQPGPWRAIFRDGRPSQRNHNRLKSRTWYYPPQNRTSPTNTGIFQALLKAHSL